MRAATHGAAVNLGHAEARAFGGDDDVGGTADADTAAEYEAVDRCDHRLGVQVHRAEGVVVAFVHTHDQRAVAGEFLDVDAGAETAAFGRDDDHAGIIVLAERVEFGCDGGPAGAVECVDGGMVEDHLGDAVFDGDGEGFAHDLWCPL